MLSNDKTTKPDLLYLPAGQCRHKWAEATVGVLEGRNTGHLT